MPARLGDLVAGSRRRAVITVVLGLLIAIVSGLYAKGIRVNTNLEALLADNARSVMALDELRQRQGPTDLLNIAVKSDDPEANRKLVEDVLARIQEWPEVRDAFIDLDYTPLRDHALYYLDQDELEQLRDRLIKERQRHVAGAMSPLGSELNMDDVVGDENWDDEDWDEDPNEEEEPELEAPPPADAPAKEDRSLENLLEDQRERIVQSGRVRESDLDLIWPQENDDGEIIWEEDVRKPVASPDQTVMLVRARLQEPPTNLQFATSVTTKVDALLEELDPETYAPGMLAKVGGAYASSNEAKSIIVDLRKATWLSAGLVIAVLLAGFRSARALITVLAPLATSVVVTVAIARLMLGELNVLTAFLFAVLLGIGVDFSVHLYAQRERQGPVADWGKLFGDHLRPLAASMLTTMGSFLVLRIADFRGFQEFGVIAAVGVVVAFVAAVLMVPALDVLLRSPGAGRAEAPADPAPEKTRLRLPALRIALLAMVGLVGVLGAPKVEFEKDMRNLRSPKSSGEKGIGYQRALKDTQETGTPVVLLADSTAQLDAAVAALEAGKENEVLPGAERSWIRSVYSLATRMPRDQASKVGVLAEIEEAAKRLQTGDADAKYRSHLDAIVRLASAKPLGEDELPLWARQLFQEKDGTLGEVGLLYTQVQGYNLDQVVYATERFGEMMEPFEVRGASSRFILGDLTIAVQDDTRRLPPYALLVIALLIAVDLRRFGPSVLVFGVLCYGLLLTFGIMGLWPIRINFYNLVVMPAVVGLGIDASIHLWHARRSGSVAATTKAALVSALTTAGAFAGLVSSQHGGLKSIGLLGMTATLCCVVVAVVALGWPRERTGSGETKSR